MLQYVSKFGKLSSGHGTRKSQYSFQSQTGTLPKNVQTTALIPHTNKVMHKILQARLQQYMNQGLPHVQARFRKGRGAGDQIANIYWIIEKAREFQGGKKSTYASLTLLKPLTVWITMNCRKFFKRWEYQTTLPIRHLIYLDAGQEAIARTRHGTTDWFKIRKGVHQDCILSPRLFNFYTEYTMQMQAGWLKSWNQDCQEKYQQPQICRWYHSNSRKWRGTKSWGEWKSWLEIQHIKNWNHNAEY